MDNHDSSFMDDLRDQMIVAPSNILSTQGATRVVSRLHPELMGVRLSEIFADLTREQVWSLFNDSDGLKIWILPKGK